MTDYVLTGGAIAFGRSLTYRFAMSGFWAAVAFADCEMHAPLTWGVVKGMLLRNLRWWSKHSDILTPQGTLTIGYTYPNQFMSESYSSPGSPYWCMIAFACLACPESHDFWTAAEEPFPCHSIPAVMAFDHPKHILIHKGGHSFLLSSGQMCHFPIRAAESKYGKLAYSSAFGFSVPTGAYMLEAIGGDNTLALSADDGRTWTVRRESINAKIEIREGVPVLISEWRPWPDVMVETFLLPPDDATPNWHIRVHRIMAQRPLLTAEGAWAIGGDQGREDWKDHSSKIPRTKSQALSVTRVGAVGIIELAKLFSPSVTEREGRVLIMDPNSNIVESRTALPTLLGNIAPTEQIWLLTAVFAMPSSFDSWSQQWQPAWKNIPILPVWVVNIIS